MDVDDLIRGPATASPTSVNSVTSATDILAANPRRRGCTITNTDANALYLLFGSGTPSSSNFNVKLLTDEVLVLEQGDYNGLIRGIWAADGSGAAVVSEFT